MTYRCIAFDLDGTLIHSAPDLHRILNLVLDEAGADPLDLATVTSFVGNGVAKLVERGAKARGLGDLAGLTARFQEIYARDVAVLTAPYAGADAALRTLRAAGLPLALVTNKPEAPSRALLDRFGWTTLFDHVVGGDTLAVRKPDPAPLLAACPDPQGVLYVGDSEVDAETARRAGVDFALYTPGYRKTPVDELRHCLAFDDFEVLTRFALQPSVMT